MPPPSPPLVLLTCGDPAGIGPEVAALAWAATPDHDRARLRLVVDPGMIASVLADRRGLPALPVTEVTAADPRPSAPGELLVIRPDATTAAAVAPGAVSAAGGRQAAAAVQAALALIRDGAAQAMVTGPLHKQSLHAAGCDVPGHTELLARGCGLPDAAASMMLWLPGTSGRGGLGVVHATLHQALRSALEDLTADRIVAAGRRLVPALQALLGRPPRVAVAALNPHGGEGGLFGDEESRLLAPAVARLASLDIDVTGPLPADSLFLRASRGEFDGIVALYHDQGHIPIKLLGMHRAVNVTLGLPLVRTSVAHGTAFDIVGTGRADPTSMVAAIAAAIRLVAAGWRG